MGQEDRIQGMGGSMHVADMTKASECETGSSVAGSTISVGAAIRREGF